MSQQQQQPQPQQQQGPFPHLLIKAGLVFSESVPLSELLCKPKLLPIRGAALERLEQLDKQIAERRKKEDEAAGASQNAMQMAAIPSIVETFVPKVEDFSKFR